MKIILTIMIFMLMLSCNKTSTKQYVEWVESTDGYARNIESEYFNINLQYCPPKYLSLTNKSEIASDSIYYFTMKLEPRDHLITNGFSFNQAYFAFDLPKDIQVKEDESACEIDFWHMENTYNITNARIFMMAVKKANLDYRDQLNFSIESKIINKDKINFTFDLSREPTVQL